MIWNLVSGSESRKAKMAPKKKKEIHRNLRNNQRNYLVTYPVLV
jgi:hypothetical protein